MNALQDALFTWDLASAPLLTEQESDAILKAARKYANGIMIGIWGGTTPTQRIRLRQKTPTASR